MSDYVAARHRAYEPHGWATNDIHVDRNDTPAHTRNRTLATRRIAAAGLDPAARDLITRMLGLEDHP